MENENENKTVEEPVTEEHAEQDRALFDEIARKKKKKKARTIRIVVIILVILAIGITIGVITLRRKVQTSFASNDAEMLSYTVETGSISTTVSGSGRLANVDEETVTVPAGVEIKKVLVSSTDTVEEGDPLATVDISSVRSALSDVQSELDDLDDQISDAANDTVSSTITAGVGGRVKKVFAEKGTDVASCMAENGALALISLDGCMSAELETDALTAGDTVTVTRADGSTIPGTVESAAGGTAVVLVTDNGPEYGEVVKVQTASGETVGSAELTIHSMLRVTGYAGTVNYVSARENNTVYASNVLFTLSDTASSANYDALLEERADKEETLQQLLEIYRAGALTAPFSGIICSVEYDEDTVDTTTETDVVVMTPGKSMSVSITVDETDILSLEVGQTATVTISSISDDPFTGTVTEIDKSATTSSGVTTYSAEITMDRADGMLRGMTAKAVVRISGVDDALIIPSEALHQTSSTSFVYTTYNEETGELGGMVTVTTGINNGSYVEITSGLSAGDTVWYTETEDAFDFSSFGGGGDMGGFSGDMSDFSGMDMPSGGGGGGMPSGGGDFGGGGGGMPSGGGRG